ncbi:hypothetical protein C0992_004045 [Termitomyces sp. T32_za158]|nr:hypothetical protein C0992_004045 [Termitomyces sp. T32_za158]
MDLRSKSKGRDVRNPPSIERTLQPSSSVRPPSNPHRNVERGGGLEVDGQNSRHSEANGPAALTPSRPSQIRPLTSPLTPLEGADASPSIAPRVAQPSTNRMPGSVPVIVTTTEPGAPTAPSPVRPRVPATRPAPSPVDVSPKRPRRSKQNQAHTSNSERVLSPGAVDSLMREANPIFPPAREARAQRTPRQTRDRVRTTVPRPRHSPSPPRAPSVAPSSSETERGFERPHVLTMTDNQLENLLRSFGTNVSRQGE